MKLQLPRIAHRIATSTGLVGLALLAAGCATQELKQDVSRLERSLDNVRAYQREQTDTINSLDSQIKTLAGRLEELEFSQNKRIGSDLDSLRQDLSSLKRRVPPPRGVPANELDADEEWASSLPPETGRLLTDGLIRLREGKYEDALALLQNAVERLEGTDRVSVPLFWQGVAYDGVADDRGALRSYSEIVSRYPKHPRAPTALLRQAEVLARLGDNKAAKLSLQKLVEDYPRSPEEPVARERMRSLR